MKLTQQETILGCLHSVYPEWRLYYELAQKWLGWADPHGRMHRGWVGTEASKRCRELRAAGLIESEPAGHYEWSRAVPPKRWQVIRDAETGRELSRTPVY